MAGAGDLCIGRLDLAENMPPVAAERFSTSVTLFGYRCAATTGTAGHIVSGRSDDLAHRFPIGPRKKGLSALSRRCRSAEYVR